jgi:site-specific DNA recombinase
MAPKKKQASADAGAYNRAVIYARYSPGPNQREESIEGQIRECKEVAKKHGLMVIHEYADRRLTGTNDERPEFQRMLRDADRGLFDVVITWKNDRFARNRYDSAIYKQRLKRNGVKIIYAKEHIPDGPEGIILESLLEGMAEYYSANLSQNIRRGIRENALEGKHFGGTVPLGYKLDHEKRYILDPEKAPLVREIFERYIAGESIVDMCDDLNRRGYTTAGGKKFVRSSLHRMLANEKYIGVMRYEDIVLKDATPRIITDEQFAAAAKRSERNKISKRAPIYAPVEFLLTGKVYCGHCGQPMGGTGGTGRHGSRFYYYQCNGRKYKKGSCNKKPIKKDILEKSVCDCVVNNIINNDTVINSIIDRCMEIQLQEVDTSPADGLRRELADAEKSLANIMRAIEAGIITASTKARLVELEERCASLRQGIAAAEIVPPKLSRDQMLFLFEKYRGRDVGDTEYMRDVIDTFVDKIYVYDDKIVITFNFSDDNEKEITIKDVEAATSAAPAHGEGVLLLPHHLHQN